MHMTYTWHAQDTHELFAVIGSRQRGRVHKVGRLDKVGRVHKVVRFSTTCSGAHLGLLCTVRCTGVHCRDAYCCDCPRLAGAKVALAHTAEQTDHERHDAAGMADRRIGQYTTIQLPNNIVGLGLSASIPRPWAAHLIAHPVCGYHITWEAKVQQREPM